MFLFRFRTFCADSEDFRRLKYLGYDRACDLVPFLRSQVQNGSVGAKVLIENVQFLVDTFHVSKLTEGVCMPPDNLFIYLFYLFIFGQKHITQGKKRT